MSNSAGEASDSGIDCSTSSVEISTPVCAFAVMAQVIEVTNATIVAARIFMICAFDEGAAVQLTSALSIKDAGKFVSAVRREPARDSGVSDRAQRVGDVPRGRPAYLFSRGPRLATATSTA